jgi:hypothetical protein
LFVASCDAIAIAAVCYCRRITVAPANNPNFDSGADFLGQAGCAVANKKKKSGKKEGGWLIAIARSDAMLLLIGLGIEGIAITKNVDHRPRSTEIRTPIIGEGERA